MFIIRRQSHGAHDTPANSCACACLFSAIQVENAQPIGHWHLWYFESTLLTNQAQPEALAHSASRWVLLVLRAKSNTQRNTYTSCKLHCIQWKSELWCYGNTRKQQLLLQKMSAIQPEEEGDRCGEKIYVRISSKKIVFKDKISKYWAADNQEAELLHEQTTRCRHGPLLPPAWALKGVTEGALSQHGLYQDLKQTNTGRTRVTWEGAPYCYRHAGGNTVLNMWSRQVVTMFL